jgi:hypothetical protein
MGQGNRGLAGSGSKQRVMLPARSVRDPCLWFDGGDLDAVTVPAERGL